MNATGAQHSGPAAGRASGRLACCNPARRRPSHPAVRRPRREAEPVKSGPRPARHAILAGVRGARTAESPAGGPPRAPHAPTPIARHHCVRPARHGPDRRRALPVPGPAATRRLPDVRRRVGRGVGRIPGRAIRGGTLRPARAGQRRLRGRVRPGGPPGRPYRHPGPLHFGRAGPPGRATGASGAGSGPGPRQVAHSGPLVNSISAAPDGLGGALVVWFGVNPLDSKAQSVALRAQHLDAQGTNQSPDSGLVVSSIASAAMAVGDGQGGLYVAWEELKSPTNPDIVAQHFGNFGDPLWSPSGSPTGRNVCAVVGIQRLRAIQEDGAGGAYVAWADSRVPGTVPLYGMRLTPGGVAAAPWPANGVQLTPLPSGIRIVGSAGAPGCGIFVSWRDINVGGQFAAQHLAADGSLRCAAAGALVAAVSVTRADLVPATSGDVFVTWSGADIRCQRLDFTRTRVWAEISGRGGA